MQLRSRTSSDKKAAASTAANATATAKAVAVPLNPKTKSSEFEFMGPFGTFVLTFLLPLVVLALGVFCDATGCPGNSVYSLNFKEMTSNALKQILATNRFHFYAYLGWFVFQILAYILVPGYTVKGTLLRNQQRLDYKINAYRVLMLVLVVFVQVLKWDGIQWYVWISDNFVQLAVAASCYATLQSVILYFYSFRSDALLAVGGNSGNPFYDFWMGRELNPRIFGLDLKYFCELRPGMFLWFILNLSAAVKQFDTLGFVSPAMLCVCLCQTIYIADSVWNEQAILTTMDITTDGFGFMLSFGDLVWVPFTFSLQSRYLSLHHAKLPIWYLVAVCALNFYSYYIFRMSNGEKNAFRTNPDDPSVQHLRYIKTSSGSKLLISGWWGVSRHPNYLGDWLMGLSWCLFTGFRDPIPYFYIVYFGFLLVHRALRDDHKCRLKYGKDWEKYCKMVKYRIIPYLY